MSTQAQFRIAVLDDYQNIALSMADWSALDGRASVSKLIVRVDGGSKQ